MCIDFNLTIDETTESIDSRAFEIYVVKDLLNLSDTIVDS